MALDTIVVIGGSGFVGRHLVNRLVTAGYRVVVPTRRRERAQALYLLPTVNVVEADVGNLATLVTLVEGARAVINLAGILNPTGRSSFASAHLGITRTVIAACQAAGVRRLLHMSALNADPAGPSEYLRSKGKAEGFVVESNLDWTVFRPSVIFGPGDSFLNLFAGFLRRFPIFPLGSPDAKFQPIYVGDVAACFAHALVDDATLHQRYALCGPRVYSLLELVRYVDATTEASRPVLTLGPALSMLQAMALEFLPGKLMSRDNLASMRKDSLCDCEFPAVFGITPAALETIVPAYLAPGAAHSAYDQYRARGGR